ncbi:ethanolamine utilization protein EutH [Salisediminibacterium selenitireducens]|uniref:Ethanolamine utilization protein EutH n=1 Tax=Bacillus selenitireducens (strain ATCC 700615 / DSM 15326 / MLS10) TaxID=439292 RepID=D6XXL1_BACIE|nr:ethanolamine utilization protein EutH [Salisediminibacterium selenitireducens]ADI00054.1 Ethanolamine utilization protein EutH [[Bacillus] selenitireducens MLS10]
MIVNQIIVGILIIFLVIGVLDKIFKLNRGYGDAFDEGFQAMGPLALVMIGMIMASPVIADLVTPVASPVFSWIGADPAMISGMLLAVDMGGYSIAMEMAATEEAAKFSGIILATMLGPTFVFTVPVALGLIREQDYPLLAKGILAGLMAVPPGAFTAGLMAGFAPGFLFVQLLPVLILVIVTGAGLLFLPNGMIRFFLLAGKGILAFTLIMIVLVAVQELLGIHLLSGFVPFSEAMEIIGLIVLALGGAFPFVHFLKKHVIPAVTSRTSIEDDVAVTGFVSSLAHSIPMFRNLHLMSEKGKLMNIAFSVSGAFVLGGHLGFTAALEPDMVSAMMTGKLFSGILAVTGVYFYVLKKS